jgi:hypothetical protein
MEDSYHVNLICCNFIKHRERETPNNHTPERSVDNGIQVGMANDARQCVVNTLHEIPGLDLPVVARTIDGLRRVQHRRRE